MRRSATSLIVLLILVGALPAFGQPHFQFDVTDINHSLLILEAMLNDEPLAVGDEVGVFTPAGLCAGGWVLDAPGDQGIGLAAFGDDANQAGINGFRANEAFTFRYWDRSSEHEVAAQAEWIDGPQVWTPNGFSVLNLSGVLEGPPDIELSAGNHDFGAVLLGDQATWQFTIRNVGVDPLTVSSVSSNLQVFTTDFPQQAVRLESNQSRAVTVTFDPTEEQEYQGELTVNSDDADEGALVIQLVGVGMVLRIPDIAVDPGRIDFGQVEVGQQVTSDLSISNTGTGDLTVSAVEINGPGFSSDFGGAFVVAAGQSAVLHVMFAPDAARDYAATLTVRSDDPDEGTVEVQLSGAGFIPAQPNITLNQAAIDFGDVILGQTSSSELTISNTGDQPLTITAIESDNEAFTTDFGQQVEEGPHFHFTVTDANHSVLILEATIAGQPLAVDDEVGVFTPAGLCAGATIVTVEGDAIGLAAWGDDTNEEGINGFQANEEMSFRFWDDSAQREMAAQADLLEGSPNFVINGFTLVNLSFEGRRQPGDAFDQTIQPGESMMVAVTFAPAAVARYESILTISSNDPDSPELEVPLMGRGVVEPARLELEEDSHDFGVVAIGSQETWTFAISNSGVSDLQGEISIVGDEDFSADIVDFLLETGQHLDITVTFRPTEAGDRSAVLHLLTNDPDAPDLEMLLEGTGREAAPNIYVDEGGGFNFNADQVSHHFGQVILGNVRDWTLTIENRGDLTLEIVDVTSDEAAFQAVFDEPIRIQPGGAAELTIRFSPEEEREYLGILTIVSNDPDMGHFGLRVDGRGVLEQLPDIVLDADRIDFEAVIAGDQRTLQLGGTNAGTADLHITQVNVAGEGFSSGFQDEIVVAPEGRFSIPVTFAPAEPGDYEGTMTITSDDPDEGQTRLSLIGRAISPGPYYQFVITDANMSIMVEEALIDGESLAQGDEVGVFTPAGLCAGGTLIEGEWPIGVAAWGDDVNAEGMQGFTDGEELNWRVWDQSVGREFIAGAEYSEGEGIYHINAFVVAQLSARRNRPPAWTQVPQSIAGNEGDRLEFTIRASDPDNDRLTLTMNRDGLPEAAAFADNGDGSGVFSWQTSYDDAGQYLPSFTVEDRLESVTVEIPITVSDVNAPPAFIEAPEGVVDGNEGEQMTFRVVGRDGEGDPFDIGFELVGERQPGNAPDFDDHHDGSGTFTWTPGFEDAGEWSAVFHLLSDNPYQPDVVLAVPITIVDVNRAPEVVADIQDVTIDEDAGRTPVADLDDVFRDPDGDALSFNASGAAELNIQLDQNSVLSIQPAANYDGQSRVTVTASDGRNLVQRQMRLAGPSLVSPAADLLVARRQLRGVEGVLRGAVRRDAEVSTSFVVTVRPQNDAPVWDDYPRDAIVVNEGSVVRFAVSAADVDRDRLTLTLDRGSIPEAARLTDSGNGTASFEWATGFADAGNYRGMLVVSDGQASARVDLFINVTNVNRAPAIDLPNDQDVFRVGVNEGQQLRVEFRALDPDEERVTWRMTENGGLPDGWEFTDHQNGTATLVWTPNFDARREPYTPLFRASDPADAADQIRLEITVGNVNHAPEVVNVVADQQIAEDAQRTALADLDDVFRDPDNDALNFSFQGDQQFNLQIDNNHVLSAQPTANWNGQAAVTVTATDGALSAQDQFTLTVTPQNDPPAFVDPIRNTAVDEGGRIQFTLRADDIDLDFEGDHLSLSLLNEDGTVARGATFRDNDNNSGTFDWQTDFVDAGEYRPIFRVGDRAGAHVETEVVITVRNVNRDPAIDLPNDQDVFRVGVNEGQELRVEFRALDPDEEQLTWRLTENGGMPDGWEFTDHQEGTATLLWTPPFEARREPYTPLFRASDPAGAADQIRLEITVGNANRAPRFVEPTDLELYRVEVEENSELRFRVRAVDPDDDRLDYALTRNDLPDGFQFNDNGDGSFTFIWQPNFDAGRQNPYTPTLGVSDGDGGADQINVEITVRDRNRPPVISQPADADSFRVDVDEDVQLQVNFRAADPDGGNVTWSNIDDGGVPQGWQFNDAGGGDATYTWTPDFNAARQAPYAPVFEATDAGGLTDRIRVEITVLNVNRSPVVVENLPDVGIDEDAGRVVVADLLGNFSDPDGDPLSFAFAGAPAEVGMALENGRTLIINPQADFNLPGGAQVTVTASDTSGGEAQLIFRVVIRPANDQPAAFDLLAPADGAVLRDYRALFVWQRSRDVDGDDIRYNFTFTFIDAPIDTTFRYGPLADTSQALAGLDTLVARYGLGDSLRIRWWVESTDGQLTQESNQRWTVVIPPLSAPPADELLPTEVALQPNYPNPFNPETKVGFALPKAGDVRLTVWDARGRQVTTLVQGRYQAGRHTLQWHANGTPAGVYLFVLETGGERRVIKGLLLK